MQMDGLLCITPVQRYDHSILVGRRWLICYLQGYLDIVKYLCEKGGAANSVDGVRGVDVRSKDGYTPLSMCLPLWLLRANHSDSECGIQGASPGRTVPPFQASCQPSRS